MLHFFKEYAYQLYYMLIEAFGAFIIIIIIIIIRWRESYFVVFIVTVVQ